MWPLNRRKTPADLAIEWMSRAIDVAAEKWIAFQFLQFKDEVPLEMRIDAFAIPLADGLRQWKAFEAAPESLFLLIAAKGIEKSSTHSRAQIEAALGVSLPNW